MSQIFYFHGGLEGMAIQTDRGWEPGFRWGQDGPDAEFIVCDSSFIGQTEKDCEDHLQREVEEDSRIAYGEMIYQAGYASACGYHD